MLWAKIGTMLGYEVTQVSNNQLILKLSHGHSNDLVAMGMLMFIVGTMFQLLTMSWHRMDKVSAKKRITTAMICHMVSIGLIMVGFNNPLIVYFDPQVSLFVDAVILVTIIPLGIISLLFIALIPFFAVEIILSGLFPRIFDREISFLDTCQNF